MSVSSATHVLLTPKEAAQADNWSKSNGVNTRDLMENAGRAVAETLIEYIGTPLEAGGEIAVLCGPGNNGGDGYVAARYLDEWGYPVKVYSLVDLVKLKGDAAYMAKKWTGPSDKVTVAKIKNAAVIVDCLFGAGLNNSLEGEAADIIEASNAQDCFRLAVDLPSGLCGAKGIATGPCFKADATVTFFKRKPGHLLAPGRFYSGGTDHVHVADIGISEEALKELNPAHFVNEPSLWGSVYPFQGPATHKYDRGHVLVLGGKEPTLGASRLASIAALRMGAGLVTLAAPTETYNIQAAALADVLVRRFDSTFGFVGMMSDTRISTVVLGPGAGISEKVIELVQQAGRKGRNMVLDADVLSSLAGRLEVVSKIEGCQIVLTPHEGEFQRLFPDLDLEEDRIKAVREAAVRSNAIVVLKGVSTLIAAKDGRVAITANAPSWLSVGGTGDILAGMISSLLGQGMPAFEAAAAGVWAHSEAGMKAGRGMIASDLLDIIPTVLPG